MSKKILILVHPGSLCGSYETLHDWHPRWKGYARARRAALCARVLDFDGTKIAVLGTQLDDEIRFRAEVQRAVEATTETYLADPASEDDELKKAVEQIWSAHRDTALEFFVTGCWCDENDGCAWTVWNELQQIAEPKGIKVTLDPEGARESDIEDIEKAMP